MTDVAKAHAQVLRYRPEPFEVACFEMKNAALHAAFRTDVLRIEARAARFGCRSLAVCFAERYTQLIREDFLGSPHAFETVGVDHLVELRNEKLIGKNRKLHDERFDLLNVLLAS